MRDKLWEGTTNLQFQVPKSLPLLISSEPLWMLLERHHAHSLFGTYQKTHGDGTRNFISSNWLGLIHGFRSDWIGIKKIKDNKQQQHS